LPYKHKIFIAGNHDDCLWDGNIEGLPDNCHFLRYSSITINGIKFHGIPMFMHDCITGNGNCLEVLQYYRPTSNRHGCRQ
jgi:hypothetical protein